MNNFFKTIKQFITPKAAENAGKNVGNAFISGIFSTKFSEQIKNWRNSAFEQIKNAFTGNNSAKILRDDVAGYLSSSVAGGLSANSKSIVKAFNAMYEKLNYQRDFDLISEAEYYRELEVLRDRYFSRGSKNWVKYTEIIYSYQREALQNEAEAIKQKYDDIYAYADKRVNEIVKKQEKFARSMGSGVLFKTNTVIMNDKQDVYYSLFDFDDDIKAIKEYSYMLSKLDEKFKELKIEDAGEYIFSYLSEMDWEQAYGYMSAIMKSGNQEIIDYANGLVLKENLARGASAMHFEHEMQAALSETFNKIQSKISSDVLGIPEEFFKSGTDSAAQFGEAFLREFDVQLANVRARIEEFDASLNIGAQDAQNVYNTNNNNSYNIQTNNVYEAFDMIKKFKAFSRLSGS